MKTHAVSMRVAAFAAAFAFATCAAAHAQTTAATIAKDAPIAATLLPTVSVFADAARPDAPPRSRIADAAPLRVTLLPTVTVTARAPKPDVASTPPAPAPTDVAVAARTTTAEAPKAWSHAAEAEPLESDALRPNAVLR